MRSLIPLLFATFALASPTTPPPSTAFHRTVVRVVDGDTIVLDHGEKVRLIGVDTPETKDPRMPIEFYGLEAAGFTQRVADGKRCRLEFDQERVDKYGRTLAYVHLEDGTFLNLAIIEEGYGFAYTRFPFQLMERFRAAERSARESGVGLWAADARPAGVGASATTSPATSSCAATTRKGTRCSRRPAAGSAYCWQHGG